MYLYVKLYQGNNQTLETLERVRLEPPPLFFFSLKVSDHRLFLCPDILNMLTINSHHITMNQHGKVSCIMTSGAQGLHRGRAQSSINRDQGCKFEP